MKGSSALYVGKVMHQRMRPRRHRLEYRMFSLLVDLDELPDLSRRLRLFSLDRFNLFSLHERDHGAGEGALREHVERQLRAAGFAPGGQIQLLTMPRILGFVFNPLSIYFCHAPDGALQALLYEVNNTFGERHSYVLAVDPAQQPGARILQRCGKALHVSPFLGMQMHYEFRVRAPDPQEEALSIQIAARDAEGTLLNARYEASRVPLCDAALARVFITHPLLTLKVVAAIHWEALRLVLKGQRMQPKPAPPSVAVSLTDPHDR